MITTRKKSNMNKNSNIIDISTSQSILSNSIKTASSPYINGISIQEIRRYIVEIMGQEINMKNDLEHSKSTLIELESKMKQISTSLKKDINRSTYLIQEMKKIIIAGKTVVDRKIIVESKLKLVNDNISNSEKDIIDVCKSFDEIAQKISKKAFEYKNDKKMLAQYDLKQAVIRKKSEEYLAMMEVEHKELCTYQVNHIEFSKSYYSTNLKLINQENELSKIENDISLAQSDIASIESSIKSSQSILEIKEKSLKAIEESNERNFFYSNECLASTRQKVQQIKDETKLKEIQQIKALERELDKRKQEFEIVAMGHEDISQSIVRYSHKKKLISARCDLLDACRTAEKILFDKIEMDKKNASNKLNIMKLKTAGLEKEYNLIDAKFVSINEENDQIEVKMKKDSETILKHKQMEEQLSMKLEMFRNGVLEAQKRIDLNNKVYKEILKSKEDIEADILIRESNTTTYHMKYLKTNDQIKALLHNENSIIRKEQNQVERHEKIKNDIEKQKNLDKKLNKINEAVERIYMKREECLIKLMKDEEQFDEIQKSFELNLCEKCTENEKNQRFEKQQLNEKIQKLKNLELELQHQIESI